jgi:hypothetical protein
VTPSPPCSSVSSQSQVGGTITRQSLQNDIPQQQAAPLSLPHLNLLFETSLVGDENSTSTADVPVIPTQNKVTVQILIHWKPFIDLQLESQEEDAPPRILFYCEHLREVTLRICTNFIPTSS